MEHLLERKTVEIFIPVGSGLVSSINVKTANPCKNLLLRLASSSGKEDGANFNTGCSLVFSMCNRWSKQSEQGQRKYTKFS